MKRFTFILFVHIMFCAQLHAQDSLSIENYKRAVSFMHENLKEKVFNTHVEPVLIIKNPRP
jgi:protein involved in temperature-dependent protein secretion